jgi:hypothetical protein
MRVEVKIVPGIGGTPGIDGFPDPTTPELLDMSQPLKSVSKPSTK